MDISDIVPKLKELKRECDAAIDDSPLLSNIRKMNYIQDDQLLRKVFSALTRSEYIELKKEIHAADLNDIEKIEKTRKDISID